MLFGLIHKQTAMQASDAWAAPVVIIAAAAFHLCTSSLQLSFSRTEEHVPLHLVMFPADIASWQAQEAANAAIMQEWEFGYIKFLL